MHVFSGNVYAPVEEPTPVVAEPVVEQAVEPIVVTPVAEPQATTETYEATFYTAYCSTGCIGITASGYDVSNTIYYKGYRILAADKSVPLYTVMRVTLAAGTTFDGIVLDRGGDIGHKRLDVLVASHDEAISLGRQAVSVEIIRRGSD